MLESFDMTDSPAVVLSFAPGGDLLEETDLRGGHESDCPLTSGRARAPTRQQRDPPGHICDAARSVGLRVRPTV
jgi:hypothetical protein